jgi:hypothetical protein
LFPCPTFLSHRITTGDQEKLHHAEKSLTSDDDQREIAEIMHHQVVNYNGIRRNDAIKLIMEWTVYHDRVKEENHFAYLVQKKSFQI